MLTHKSKFYWGDSFLKKGDAKIIDIQIFPLSNTAQFKVIEGNNTVVLTLSIELLEDQGVFNFSKLKL